MQTLPHIMPHLWFDQEAKEAAEFYTAVFPDSGMERVTTIRNTPSGDCDMVSFHVCGQPFMAISAGPLFKFNPSSSFMVHFDASRDSEARRQQEHAWEQLSAGGTALMPLDQYPFSERYGWIQDRYGLSWQLMLTGPDSPVRPQLMPSLMFTNALTGKAEEASDFYLSVFQGGERGTLARYPSGMEPDREGTVMYTDFRVAGSWFAAMDSARSDFAFNEAVSFMIRCDGQEEIDYYWKALSADPAAEQCGWCKDRYGLSWQITPSVMTEMLENGSREQLDRVTRAFLQMKKFDVHTLVEAYEGR